MEVSGESTWEISALPRTSETKFVVNPLCALEGCGNPWGSNELLESWKIPSHDISLSSIWYLNNSIFFMDPVEMSAYGGYADQTSMGH